MTGFEKDVLQRFPSNSLTTDAEFCRAVGEIQGKFLAITRFGKTTLAPSNWRPT